VSQTTDVKWTESDEGLVDHLNELC